MTRAFLGIFVGAWVARYLGPQEFGELSYVLAILAFFQAVTNLGMDGIIVRDIAGKKNDTGKILGSAFVMRLVAGFSCWVLAILLMFFFAGERVALLTAIAGGSLVFQAADVIDLWFQSQSQSRRTVVAKLTAYVVSNGLRISFIAFKLPLIFFAVAMLLEFATTAIVLTIIYRRIKHRNTWEFDARGVGKTMLDESWPIILSGISIIIYMRIDQIMIRNFLGESDLGIYSALLLISTGWYVVPNVLCVSLMPVMSRLRGQDIELYNKRLSMMFKGFLAISIGVCLLVMWQSENLIYLIYGNKYTVGGKALSIHIFTNIPVFLGFGQSLWVLNERRPKMFLIQTLVGGIISISLNIVLIPRIGIVGASISAVISQTASAVLTNFFIERNLFLLQIGLKPNLGTD